MNDKRKFFQLLSYLLLIFAAYFIVDIGELLRHLTKISLSTAIFLILIASIDRFVMTAKWMQLCSALSMTTGYLQLLKIYYAGIFIAYCLPTTIGGEVYRATRLSRLEKSHDVLASIFIEKIIGVFSTVCFAWVGAIYIAYNVKDSNSTLLSLILASFTFGALFLTWLFFHDSAQKIIIRWTANLRIEQYLEKLATAYTIFSKRRGVLAWNFILAVLETTIQLSIMVAVGIALNMDIPPPLLISIIAITEFVRRATIILDGWGLIIALQVYMYSLVGIGVEQALLIALVNHAVHFVAMLPGGLIVLTDRWDKK